MSGLPSVSDVASWAPLLGQLLAASPYFVVYIAGLTLAIVRWRQHPRVCLLVALACGIDIFAGLAGAGLSMLPIWFLQKGGTMAELGVPLAIANAIVGMVRLGAYGLLLAAAFAGRRASTAQVPVA